MTDLLSLPMGFLLLLPFSVAAGMDLYLTLLTVSLTAGMATELPAVSGHPPYAGFASIVMLGLLYLAEFAAEQRPSVALVWHNLQLLLRPLGGALLGIVFLEGEPPAIVALGMGLASIVAAFTHVLAWGGSLLLRLVPGHGPSPILLSLAQDAGTVGLLALALLRPDLAFLGTTGLLIITLVMGRPLHAVVRFGWALMEDSIWGIVSSPRWRRQEELPRWLRKETNHLPPHWVRGIRAATVGVSGPGHFTEGWVVDVSGETSFCYRRKLAGRIIPLTALLEGEPRVDALSVRIPLRSVDAAMAALFLQKGAPGIKSHK